MLRGDGESFRVGDLASRELNPRVVTGRSLEHYRYVVDNVICEEEIDRVEGWLGSTASSPEQRVLESIRRWQRSHPATALRIYRTAAGYRVLVSNRCFDGVDESEMQLLEQLESDPLYRQLCRSQSCFRARLSPKPWRIGAGKPPARFPFADEAAERRYQAWYDRYVAMAKGYNVCRYLNTLGTTTVDPAVEPLVDRHDGLACGDRPLA